MVVIVVDDDLLMINVLLVNDLCWFVSGSQSGSCSAVCRCHV